MMKHTLDRIYLVSILHNRYFQVSLHNNDKANKRMRPQGFGLNVSCYLQASQIAQWQRKQTGIIYSPLPTGLYIYAT